MTLPEALVYCVATVGPLAALVLIVWLGGRR